MAFVRLQHKKELFMLLVTLALLAAGLAFQGYVSNMMEADMEEKLLEITVQVRQSLDARLQSNFSTLRATAKFLETDATADPAAMRDFVEDQRAYNGFQRMGAVSLCGNGVYGPDAGKEHLALFREAFRGNNVMTYLADSPFGDKNCIVMAMPYYHGETVIGAVYAIYDEASLPGISRTDIYGGQGRSLLLGNEFETSIPPLEHFEKLQESSNETDRANQEAMDRMKQKLYLDRSAVEKFYVKDDAVYTGIVPLHSLPGWYASCSIPASVLMDKVQSITLFSSLIVIGLCFLLVILSWLFEEFHRKSNRRIYELAYADKLTGIPNWEKCRQDCGPLLSGPGADYILAVTNIDGFHTINNILGKTVCDRLLCDMAALFTGSIGKKELACRASEDRFALLLHSEEQPFLEKRLLQMIDAASKLIPNFHITLSAGVFRLKGPDPVIDLAFENCMFAQKTAKENQGNSIAFYDSILEKRQQMYRTLENDFMHAIEEQDFLVYLHPFVDLNTARLLGAEASVRWRHPTFGLLEAAAFQPLLEANGLISVLDHYTLCKVCTLLRDWRARGQTPPPIFISLSWNRMMNSSLESELEETVRRYGLPAALVGLNLVDHPPAVEDDGIYELMASLRQKGFRLCINHLGTGCLAPGGFHQVHGSLVKLDKTFLFAWKENKTCVEGFLTDVTNMLHHLEIQIIAEGIEDKEQVCMLRMVGCEFGQGPYYSNPIPSNTYELLLEQIAEKGTLPHV